MADPSKLAALVARLSGQAPQSKLPALLKARRQFDVVPWDIQAVEDGDLPLRAFLETAEENKGARGVYVTSPLSATAPIPHMGLSRSIALYPRGNRATRRHEVMHGIQNVARADPEVSKALPWWARRTGHGDIRDELLARLASGEQSQLTGWPLGSYAAHHPEHAWQYHAAKPAQVLLNDALYTHRGLSQNPLAYASLAGTVGGLAAASASSEDD